MTLFIYLISFLEGFTTLSIEIIAIRNFTPIIGTNSISTSIILGVILLALSYGYYIGGKNSKGKGYEFLKNKIILNLGIAGAYYIFFTFSFDIFLINYLLKITGNYFFSILLSSFFLFFIPVFYASQTIPLLSEMLKGDNTGEKIGKLLFFSTVGSFFGSVITSTILFSFLGVEKSAVFNSIILSFIGIILSFRSFKKVAFPFVLCLIVFFASVISISTNNKSQNLIFEKANSYHNIKIVEDLGIRLFMQNLAFSSGIEIKSKESFFNYIIEIKKHILDYSYDDICIIGAAGFTLPQELAKYEQIKIIDVVDIDGELKEISEKYFLQEKINQKVNFIVESCRYFINNTIKKEKKYGALVVDIYVGNSLAPQTLTKEFFLGLKSISNDIYINLITDPGLNSVFSKKIFATMEEAFGDVYFLDVNKDNISLKTNFIVTNKNIPGYIKYKNNEKVEIYTDDKNTIELDLFKIIG